MNCPNCQQECKYDENRFYSFRHVRISCDNLDCPSVKRTGFKFILDYKKYTGEMRIILDKETREKDKIEIVSINYLFEHKNHWYLFSQSNRSTNSFKGTYTLYYFSEERRRGQQWGTFKSINDVEQDLVPIDPNNLAHDIMKHFHRIMNLKAFL